MPITCPSRITRVTVHGRGALVTRRLTVEGSLPDGDVELAAEGVTVLAEAGSARASLVGAVEGRTVVAVRSTLAVPAEGSPRGPSAERVHTLAARAARMEAEREVLASRREQLAGLTLAPRIGSTTVGARTEDSLATAAMLDRLGADLDARLGALEASLRELARERDAAALADAQARTAERTGSGHPSRTFTVHLAGAGAVEAVDVTYAVPAARWWPVYTLRITDGGRRARWWIEALVGQRSGEDWTGVRLALSTADLVFDARLPELPSLRLGRAQPSRHRGYRAPPPGLDRMFAGHDRAFGTATFGMGIGPPRSASTPTPAPEPALDDDDEGAGNALSEASGDLDLESEAMPKRARRFGGPRGGGGGVGAALMASPTATGSTGMTVGAAMPAGRLGGPPGGAPMGGAPPGSAPWGGGAPQAPEPEVEAPVEPADAWLDFDALTLRPAGETPRRGRLARTEDLAGAAARRSAVGAIEGMPAPQGAQDPVVSRGMFDHRYDADGMAEVPSDGQSHRVMLGTAETVPTVRWRTVPRESPEVYREAEFRNPFEAPLLAGPVDVYMDGGLLAVAAVERIDRGGTMHVGMGVEERLRVARNVRAAEEPAGLLGGSTAVLHTVSIELTSALGTGALVEVVDRVPVSDEKGVEVVMVSARPEGEAYTQAERGAAVRGGLLWRQIVPAGARSTIEYQYRITLPSRSEIVGGNRRD